jgi:hypothetical protein
MARRLKPAEAARRPGGPLPYPHNRHGITALSNPRSPK